MTPCSEDRAPDFDALVRKGKELIAGRHVGGGLCGSMGDWPLLTDEQRKEGVERLVQAGVPVIVGAGAVKARRAPWRMPRMPSKVGAKGLMIIPRVLSRGSSSSAQKDAFQGDARGRAGLPAVIYNSPYYGFETKR